MIYNKDILVIHNSCVGVSEISNLYGKYNNMFIWNRIDDVNFNKLILGIKSINFKNYKFNIANYTINSDGFENHGFEVIFDNYIQVHYPHGGKSAINYSGINNKEKFLKSLNSRIDRFYECLNNNPKIVFWLEEPFFQKI